MGEGKGGGSYLPIGFCFGWLDPLASGANTVTRKQLTESLIKCGKHQACVGTVVPQLTELNEKMNLNALHDFLKS